MNDRPDLLSRYRTRPAAVADESSGAGAPTPARGTGGSAVDDDDRGGHVQRERHQIMLTLETRDGLSTALAYSYLSTIRFDPRGTLELALLEHA